MNEKKIDKSVKIFDVIISGTDKDRVLKRIFSRRKKMLQVVTVNSEFVMEARENKSFRRVLNQADLAVADGWGVVWAAKILAGRKIDRITGHWLAEKILARANLKKERVFLLGGKPGVVELAIKEMKKRYPGAELAGWSGARRAVAETREERGVTLAKINAFQPDYLLVAYGYPIEEEWIARNRAYLKVRVAIGVGGVVDEWAGVVKRTPSWVDEVGGRWLWRLAHQPWRWRRILRVLKFGVVVVVMKFRTYIRWVMNANVGLGAGKRI